MEFEPVARKVLGRGVSIRADAGSEWMNSPVPSRRPSNGPSASATARTASLPASTPASTSGTSDGVACS